MRGNWNLAETRFGIVLENFRSLQTKRRIGKLRTELKKIRS